MYATISFVHNGNIYIGFSDSLSNAVAGLLKSGFWEVDENLMWFRRWVSEDDITDAYVKHVELCVADKYELTVKAAYMGTQRVFKKTFPTKKDATVWVETNSRDPRWGKYNISIVEEKFVS